MTPLRVLQVNHADTGGGGASIAGFRLHHALRNVGVHSRMVVGSKASQDPDVTTLRSWRTVRRPLRAVTESAGLNELDGIGAYALHRSPEFVAAHVVHYHAIHGGWFSYPAMPHLTRLRPSVLTLHDQWPLTGHCSFSFECERWRRGCGACPHPEVFPAIRRDATAIEWRLKERVWRSSSLTVVSPSIWLAGMARESMLGDFEVEVIPHGIDTGVFAPVDREAARRALTLDPAAPVVMFAASSVADRRKGADLVAACLGHLPPVLRQAMTVLLMGGHGAAMRPTLEATGCRVVDVGFVPGEQLKAMLYSAADAFVFPTRADNSPLVALESLACGTPVVSFDVGGVGEMVRPGRTGLLAPPGDATALAHHLEAVVEDGELRRRLGARARAMVVEEYPAALAAERHATLYRSLLDREVGTA